LSATSAVPAVIKLPWPPARSCRRQSCSDRFVLGLLTDRTVKEWDLFAKILQTSRSQLRHRLAVAQQNLTGDTRTENSNQLQGMTQIDGAYLGGELLGCKIELAKIGRQDSENIGEQLQNYHPTQTLPPTIKPFKYADQRDRQESNIFTKRHKSVLSISPTRKYLPNGTIKSSKKYRD
jgi:hypothetical protein